MDQRSSGFTLIEMAIVLVIVGLLIGGVLAGQQLIQSARVRNLISQQDGVKAAFFGFQDRYRALPGDYSGASININCGTFTCVNGNGNGRIEASGATVHEEILAWNHLAAAGFINGSYTMPTSGVAARSAGQHPNEPLWRLYASGLRRAVGCQRQLAWQQLQAQHQDGEPSAR